MWLAAIRDVATSAPPPASVHASKVPSTAGLALVTAVGVNHGKRACVVDAHISMPEQLPAVALKRGASPLHRFDFPLLSGNFNPHA